MRAGAVVVTHGSDAVLPALLEGLAHHEPAIRVVVVDSGSPGGPPAVPHQVGLLALEDNVGFGRGCNLGAERLLAEGVDAIICLNPDVRLVGPSLTQLVGELEARTSVGVATGPVVDAAGRRISSAWGPTSLVRAAWFASGWQLPRLRRMAALAVGGVAGTSTAALVRDDIRVTGHVLGGAMLVRRACWIDLGGFDEDYFLYWEDADLCHRARQLGWEVRLLPCTPIVHQVGTSSEGVDDDRRWRWYVQGAETFVRKHLSRREGRRLLGALRWGSKLRR